jgi:hypothetical protein
MRPPILSSVRRACAAAPRATSVCAVTIVAALTATAGVLAAETPPLPNGDIMPDQPARPLVPTDDPAAQAHLPGCTVWTDRCITCKRTASRISCSNIGIACQPQAVECLQREPPEKKPDAEKQNQN